MSKGDATRADPITRTPYLWDEEDMARKGLRSPGQIPAGDLFVRDGHYYLRLHGSGNEAWRRVEAGEARDILRGPPSDEDLLYVMRSLGVEE
jgi:hypothetical protein